MKKKLKITLGVILGIIVALLLTVGGYVIYLQANYSRIDDFTKIATENNTSEVLKADGEYSAVTYNIGFGAYEPEFTFFMDTGIMKDGTEVSGTEARAFSEENARKNTEGAIRAMTELDSDFYIIEEVDKKATRSYDINQYEMICQAMPDYGNAYTSAFHSVYLFYPLTQPHGSVESGLVTLSKYHIDESMRRQFPVSTSFIDKFFDLDRCFTVSRIPIDNGKELVLISLHMSAYDKGGEMRKKQLEMLNGVFAEEYAKGNYVVAGGDWNHDIAGTIDTFECEQKIPGWVYQLDDSQLSEGFSFVIPENASEVPSCRGADVTYKKGYGYTVTVDGFVVSDNVEAVSEVIDTEFAYSDHQPVKVTFKLK